jgi:peptidoglycan/LPS O-acetylase OafA/YrhL
LPPWAARAGSRLASISYSLYATHYPLVALAITLAVPHRIGHAGLSDWGFLGLLAIPVLAVSVAFHALFERQTPRLRRLLRRRAAPAGDAPVDGSASARVPGEPVLEPPA